MLWFVKSAEPISPTAPYSVPPVGSGWWKGPSLREIPKDRQIFSGWGGVPVQESKLLLFWKNKKKRDLLLSILLVVAAALSLAVSMILDNPHLSPSNVVQSFTDACYRQDQQQFWELLPPGTEEMQQLPEGEVVLDSAMNNFWSRLDGSYQCRVVALDSITDNSLDRILNYYQGSCTVLQAQTATVETTYSLYGQSISVENEVVVLQTPEGWYLDLYSNFILGAAL